VTRKRLALMLAAAAGAAIVAVLALRDGGRPDEPASSYVPRPPGTLSFNVDIAPIVHRRCAPCHRPGEPAPFDLLTYEDVESHAKQILDVTSSGFMPPWPLAPGKLRFVGERRLTPDEKGMIRQWVEEGAARGDDAAEPVPPTFTEGWQLGEPDLVLEMSEAYPMPAGGRDVFRNFVIPTGLDRTRWVQALEFRPGTPRAVHHADILVDRTGRSRFHDQRDPGPGFDGMLNSSAEYPDGQFLGWAPGKMTRRLPEEISWRLDPGTDMIVQLHLQPTGKPEAVRSKIGLYFAEGRATRTAVMLRLGPRTIDVPAGESDYVTEDSYVLPVDVDVLSLVPHAHYLGHDMRGWAVLPDGTRVDLLHIPDWDFNWQDEYRLAEPLSLPAGTTLFMRFTFDNSSANVRNPNDPPQRVVFGPRTSNEMGDLWIQVLSVDERQRTILAEDFGRKERDAHIACYEKMIANDPQDVSVRYELGEMLTKLGRPEQAIEQFVRALEIDPDHVPTHAALGILLHDQGRFDEAEAHFRQAIAGMPELAEAHFNLGQTLLLQGRLDEALDEYKTALELQPEFAPAEHHVGEVLRMRGDLDGALRAYLRALEIDPGYAQAHNNVGSILASRGDLDGALEHFQRAVELDPNYAQAYNNLGMALAAKGRLDDAVAQFARAVELRPDHEPSRQNLARALELQRRRP